MANENPSRENPSRQQSAERSQNLGQQGTGTQGAGTRSGATQGSGSYGQGGYGQGGQGEYGRGTGTSTWQGGRQSGGNLQRRGSQGMSPYSGYSQGFGGGPFSVMRRISDEMDRLFENFGMGRGLFGGEGRTGAFDVGGYGEGAPSMWSPHVEVCERNGKLLIQADLPGMKRDDVHVRVEQDQVIIQGERRQEQQHDQGEYYRSERSYGSFYRTIPLPEGSNTESATASFRDGVLEIEVDMPRHQERGRTLEIREGGSSSSGMQSGSYAGTGSGATYGSGTSGSMQGSTSGATGAGQHAASGTSGSQQSSGTGTMYSGSGDPSAGAAGVAGGSEDRTKSHGNR